MATKTITGTLYEPGANAALAFVDVTVDLLTEPSIANSALYLPKQYSGQTNGSGVFSVELPVPDSGVFRYKITLPYGNVYYFNLGANSSTDLLALIADDSVKSSKAGVVSGAIGAHAADDDAHHAPVAIGTNTASALSLSGQEISLGDVFLQKAGDTMDGDLTMGSGTQIIARTGTATDPSIRGSGSSNTGVNISGTTVQIVSEGAVIAAFKDITFPDNGRELDLYGGKIFNYGEYSSSRSISSGSLSFPVNTNNVFTVSLNQNVTSISITWPDDIEACSFEVYYTQDATGGRTVSHTGMKGRDSGTAPDISTTANAVSRVVYSTPDGGTTVYADLIGKDYGTIS